MIVSTIISIFFVCHCKLFLFSKIKIAMYFNCARAKLLCCNVIIKIKCHICYDFIITIIIFFIIISTSAKLLFFNNNKNWLFIISLRCKHNSKSVFPKFTVVYFGHSCWFFCVRLVYLFTWFNMFSLRMLILFFFINKT